MLSALARGQSLRQALDSAARARFLDGASLERALFRWFREWTSDGLFERIELPPLGKARGKGRGVAKSGRGVRLRDRGKLRRDSNEAVLPLRGEGAIPVGSDRRSENGRRGAEALTAPLRS